MDGGLHDFARIGPNAILQLIPVLDRTVGAPARRRLMMGVGVAEPPSDAGMWLEAEVVRLHRAVVAAWPDQAAHILRQAGLGTGDYILAHRIPPLAQRVIRALPRGWAARVLAKAIEKHAWTFAGSGRFRVVGHAPLTFEIAENPLAVGSICHWHAAVFERLFRALVWPRAELREVACCGVGHAACRFVILPQV